MEALKTIVRGTLRVLMLGWKTDHCFLARGTAWKNYHNCWLTVKKDQSMHGTSLGPPGIPVSYRSPSPRCTSFLYGTKHPFTHPCTTPAIHNTVLGPIHSGLHPFTGPGDNAQFYRVRLPLQQ